MPNYQLLFSPALDQDDQNKMFRDLMKEQQQGNIASLTLKEIYRGDGCNVIRCYVDPDFGEEHFEHLQKEFNLTDYCILGDDPDQFTVEKSLIRRYLERKKE
jgi:hypothetical protein